MPLKDVSVLRGIPLFALFDDAELNVLAGQLDERFCLAGQLIFSAGDPGGTMFIVQSGRVEIFLQDKADERVILTTIERGDLFGEFSLLDNEPRSASAKALENTELLIVDRNDLQFLIKTHPDAALDMMMMLTRRIRESNMRVQERVTRNVNEEIPRPATLGERLSDLLTAVAGDIRFVYFSALWFVIWIVANAGIIPNVHAFDPFPYGLLTMVVSLEAIFLSLFVLISQNRQAAREKIRNDIEYEVNLKAEVEVREIQQQIETLQQLMIQHFADLNALKAAQQTQQGS